MEQAMQQMQGESMEENLDDLRKILENLVIFSFKQEQLINTFTDRSTVHPDFGEDLKKQNQLKNVFLNTSMTVFMFYPCACQSYLKRSTTIYLQRTII